MSDPPPGGGSPGIGQGAIGIGGIGAMAIGVGPGDGSVGRGRTMIVPPDYRPIRLLVELTLKVRPE